MSIEVLNHLIWQPFADFGFMRRALVGCAALALGSSPLGVLLLLRRMSLMGDAMSHAILPGAAIGFLFFGLSLPAMTLGGLIAGLAVAALAGLVSRVTRLREDESFAAFYLISLALGVLLVSTHGSNVDLLHVLFGTVLSLDDATLILAAGIASLTLVGLALLYRPIVMQSVDPNFMRLAGHWAGLAHGAFLFLLVINLVGGFHTLGTLMAVSFMVLPAAIARFWARTVAGQMCVAAGMGLVSGYLGLLLSYNLGAPASTAIVLTMGVFYILSLLLGRWGGIVTTSILQAKRLPPLSR